MQLIILILYNMEADQGSKDQTNTNKKM